MLFTPCEDSEGPPDLAVAGGDDSIVPVYYPGTEIEGYMPHRGDFTVVSASQRLKYTCHTGVTLQ